MELEGIMLSKVSQSEDKHCMFSFIWGIWIIVKGNIREGRRNEWEISERETEHKLLTLGKELGVIEGEVAGGLG